VARRKPRRGSLDLAEPDTSGREWEASGTVHVELCETEPGDREWTDREVGAWVESQATYSFQG
jgi:hypothetical protein